MANFPPTPEFIKSLDPNSPINENQVLAGDDWFRFVQQVLENQFPTSEDGSSNGWDLALTVKASEVNTLQGVSVTDPLITLPAGTAMLFYQNSAPEGWSIVSAVDEHSVRLTQGTGPDGDPGAQEGGTIGGTNNFSAQFTSINSGSESTHTHTWSDTSSGPSSTSTPESGGGDTVASQSHTHTVSGTTSGGAAHLHTIDMAVKWAACIVAAKD